MERQEVLQQKLEHWCAASIRALADQPSVHYRGHQLVVKERPFIVSAPYLQLDLATHDNKNLRGVADAVALRLIHCDQALYEQLKPKPELQFLVFELLEQLRCESLAPERLPGMRTNLRARYLYWLTQAGASKLVENNVGLLIFTLSVVVWSRLQKQTIPELIEEVIEGTRWGFSARLREHLLALPKTTSDQREFATHALAVAVEVDLMIESSSSNVDGEVLEVDDSIKSLLKSLPLNSQWLDNDSRFVQDGLLANQGVSLVSTIDSSSPDYEYQVYSREHDKVINADDGIRRAQLLQLRSQLDKRVREQSVNVHRVGRYLQQLISQPKLSGWSFGEEEGYLDAARLSRLLCSPDELRIFRKEQYKPASDCVVSILIDNSGSMTHHNEAIAALVDTLAKALELAQINSEVLGFTTNEWNGGRILKQWVSDGKPTKPGRLNSVCHTVYKSAETPWRRARASIAALLKSDRFREAIDGEALEWAAQRLENRSEAHKILLVISDGSPMDSATHAANDEQYLDQHLCRVTKQIEQRADIKLCAIGVGLDLSAYYQASMPISMNNVLDNPIMFSIADLISRAK